MAVDDIEPLPRRNYSEVVKQAPKQPLQTLTFPRTRDSFELVDLTKEQREAEINKLKHKRTLSRNSRTQRKSSDVIYGTPIIEGHQHYALMYDMLTGIRISVSRAESRPLGEVQQQEFKAAHKLAFDALGNELTPKSKYDFKFKDYCPTIFRRVREAFHVDASEYLLSLTGKYILSEFGSPGKSGSFFYYSRDYRFIIKTIRHSEHQFLLSILKDYYEHVKSNPHTLLTRIFGVHRVKQPGNRKIHFVVMGNVFPSNKDIHEVYDLKGSLLGRNITQQEIDESPRAVMKDLNWLERSKTLQLGPEKRHLLSMQLERDVKFLVDHDIMDYSLLIGIHDTVKGNADDLRKLTLGLYEPDRSKLHSKKMEMSHNVPELTEDIPKERLYCIFYQDHGGFRATDDLNLPIDEIYYLGIIDIFTRYSATKKIENFFKSFAGGDKISSVPPNVYGNRFLKFIQNAIKDYQPFDNSDIHKLLRHKTQAKLSDQYIASQ
ncbi:hypothetical protein EDD86DRAFT_200509 [Gorgonomyces haynaldii]|nr:hypothetical protein EDD86DRAFT_200509 [Gorgonomyces haynaldii]